ncbi:MAG: oligosaccharide flippase family protein [Planctomycetota bacterium]|jgi:O-antigen/teichoic acid export membrane protein
MRKELIKNTLFSCSETFVITLMWFILTPYMIHKLGKEAFGIYALLTVFSITGYLALLEFGIHSAAVKFIAEYNTRKNFEKLNAVINTSLFVLFISGGIAGIGLFFLTKYFIIKLFHIPFEYAEVTRILLYLLAFQLFWLFPSLIFNSILEGLQRYDILKGIFIVYDILLGVSIFLLLESGYGLLSLGILGTVLILLRIIIIIISGYRLLSSLELSLKWIKLSVAKEHFRLSKYLFLSRIVGLIFNRTDRVLIGLFLVISAFTEYEIVLKFHQAIALILAFMNSAVVPTTSRLEAENDLNKLQKLFLRGTKYSVALILPITIVGLIFFKQFLKFWLVQVQDFTYLTLTGQIFILHFFLSATTGIGSTMLVGLNKMKRAVIISIAGAVFNLTFSIIAVRFLGLLGLVLGTVLAYIFIWYPYLVYILKVLKLSWGEFFTEIIFKPYTLAFIFAAVVVVCSRFLVLHNLFEFLLMGGGFVLVYYLAFFFLGLKKEEQEYLYDIIKRQN